MQVGVRPSLGADVAGVSPVEELGRFICTVPFFQNRRWDASVRRTWLPVRVSFDGVVRRCRCGRGEPSPGVDAGRGEPSLGADVAGVSPVPVQMWQGWAQSWCCSEKGAGAGYARGAYSAPSSISTASGPRGTPSVLRALRGIWSTARRPSASPRPPARCSLPPLTVSPPAPEEHTVSVAQPPPG
jgi:hypothetical protein